MKAEIITIGDEILIGQIVDTNSAWIAQQLQELGIPIVQITSISDGREAIQEALALAATRANLILITGGLGPTKDDITKQAAATYFGCDLVRDPAVLEHVSAYFTSRGRQMLAVNEQQADVLSISEVLFNEVGTAPAMWVDFQEAHYVFMPGVPFEMKHIISNKVLPKVRPLLETQALWHENILIGGIGESYLADQIADIEDQLPEYIKLAYLPSYNLVRLRLSAKGSSLESLQKETLYFADRIAERVQANVLTRDQRSLQQLIVETFSTEGISLTTTESCTGGSIAALITSIPGSSAMYIGGTVPYSNRLKEQLVQVKSETLQQYGAVSMQTVIEMSEGAKKPYQADYAIATSGIAGPSGGSIEKPVGTVWIAVAGRKETLTASYHFKNDRTVNIARTQLAALLLLWELYRKESQ